MNMSDSTVTAFQEDGVVVLRGVFRDWVEPLPQGVAEIMAHPRISGIYLPIACSRSRSAFDGIAHGVSFHPDGSVPMRASCGAVHRDRRHFLI
jgi:hypothetical protein